MTKPTLVIMAAGLGSRYGGLKQLEPIGPSGELIIDYSIFDAVRAGFDRVVLIIRKDFESDFRKVISDRFVGRVSVEYVFQELNTPFVDFVVSPTRTKPWGTGHAVLASASLLSGPFAVINADDFYGFDAFRVLFDYLRILRDSNKAPHALVGYMLGQTLSPYGLVTRGVCELGGDHLLREIREIAGIESTEHGGRYRDELGVLHQLDSTTVVSMNMWGFTTSILGQLQELFVEFLGRRILTDNDEFVLPVAVGTLLARGHTQVQVLPTSSQWFGLTHAEDKRIATTSLALQAARGDYPSPLWR